VIYLKEGVDGYRGGLVVDDEPVCHVLRRQRCFILRFARKISVFDYNLSTEKKEIEITVFVYYN